MAALIADTAPVASPSASAFASAASTSALATGEISAATDDNVDADAVANSIPSSVRLRFHWEGYLQKRSDWLKHWETYYFVLRGRLLYCYLTAEDARQQPEKSKIKKGKFGFADRVTLTRVWDVEESTSTATTSTTTSTTTTTTGAATSSSSTTAAAAAAASAATAPLSSPSSAERHAVSPFRFTFETGKGHHLHFRTHSDASKFMWLHVATNAIHDYDAQGTLRPAVKKLRTNVDDFYVGYEFFASALSELVSVELLQQHTGNSGDSSLYLGGGDVGDVPKTSSSSKVQSTYRTVAPSQPLRKTRRSPPLDRLLTRFFSLLSPEVILRSNYLPMVPFEGKFRGYNGILEYFVRVSESANFEQFCVESIEIERDETGKNNRIVVVKGRETMQVRSNQATFMQQFTHKLHFKPNGGGLVSRWEIFGDVVASSVVFKVPGFSSNLMLPSLTERIRESFVGGYIVSVNLQHVADVRSRELLQKDVRFSHCFLFTIGLLYMRGFGS